MKSSFLNLMDKARLTHRQKKRAKIRHNKKLRKIKKEKKELRLKEYADQLNKYLPKSEIWFNDMFVSNWFYKYMQFKTNTPFQGFIPDLISIKFKLVIEIDGSIHEKEEQKIKDFKKDTKYKKTGYQVIRVIAYNHESYSKCISLINDLLNSHGINEVTVKSITEIQKTTSKKALEQEEFKKAINSIDLNKKLPF